MTNLVGKVILVAGATGGMGREVALLAAKKGAKVVAIARDAVRLEALSVEIMSGGGQVLAIEAPASDHQAMETAVADAVHCFGHIDAMVNAIGGNIMQRALTVLDKAGWSEVMEANLDVALALTMSVLPTFRAQKDGLIVHIASSAAKRPDQSGAAYQAAKSAVVGLAHATMQEEQVNGIRVSVVFPGLTDTPLVAKRPTPVPAHIMRHSLQPEDVAAACLALIALPPRAYVPEIEIYPSML
jgi:NADP-dependent 3-hydroxy acid dehydrogenase YdfG